MLKNDVGQVSDWFEDMVAYLELNRSNPQVSSSSIVSMLAHDLGGIIRQERGFTPRTNGYEEHLKRSGEDFKKRVEKERSEKELLRNSVVRLTIALDKAINLLPTDHGFPTPLFNECFDAVKAAKELLHPELKKEG